MTRKKRGRRGADRAALKHKSHSSDLTATPSRIKGAIVGAACRGLLPFKLANWLILRLHLAGA